MAYFCPWLVHTNSVICRHRSRASSVVDTVFEIIKKSSIICNSKAIMSQVDCSLYWLYFNVKRDTRWFFKPMWLLSKRCAWQLPKRLWKKRRPNLTCTPTCNQEEEIELLREMYLKDIICTSTMAFTFFVKPFIDDVKVNQIMSGLNHFR